MTDWKDMLRSALGEAVLFDEPLAGRVAFRIGGPAEALARPSTAEELRATLEIARTEDVPVTLLGSGSNVLVSDQGIRGITVRLRGELADVRIEPSKDGAHVDVGAGALNAQLVSAALDEGLVGIEFLATIPGTFGGALIMNAGAHGGEICESVVEVQLLDASLAPQTRDRAACGFEYRSSGFGAGEILTGARLRLTRGDTTHARAHLKEMRDRRRASQPIGQPNAGSIFKNPPGDYAGRLIETCGLKGLRVGAASVSELHANFIVNEGGATAEDVCAVAAQVQATVSKAHAIDLEWEVRRIGVGFDS